MSLLQIDPYQQKCSRKRNWINKWMKSNTLNLSMLGVILQSKGENQQDESPVYFVASRIQLLGASVLLSLSPKWRVRKILLLYLPRSPNSSVFWNWTRMSSVMCQKQCNSLSIQGTVDSPVIKPCVVVHLENAGNLYNSSARKKFCFQW